jgi:hypothetical protein
MKDCEAPKIATQNGAVDERAQRPKPGKIRINSYRKAGRYFPA